MSNTYAVVFKGRATRSPLGDQAKETLFVDALDIDSARELAGAAAAAGMKLNGVNCDLVTVADVSKARKAKTTRR